MANDKQLTIKRVFKADREALFKAFSDDKIMSQWFFAENGWSVDVNSHFEVGGEYKVDMKNEKGDVYPHSGKYKEISKPEKIVFTWSSQIVKDSVVTLDFREVSGGTELTLTHNLFPDNEVRDKHNMGWTGCLDSLERYINSLVLN